jgi:hypothetical protein
MILVEVFRKSDMYLGGDIWAHMPSRSAGCLIEHLVENGETGMKLGLYITLEPAAGKPVTLARVFDRSLLTGVARTAIREAEEQAELMAAEDETLGTLQLQEASRLRTALELVIPELRNIPGDPAARLM